MKRFTVFLLVTAGLIAAVIMISLLASAVPAVANPNIRIDVNYGHGYVSGTTATSFADVTITVSDNDGVKATYNDQTDENGKFFTMNDWEPDRPVILPGDVVTATLGVDSTGVNPVGAINGILDLEADTVAGTIEAPWFSTVNVSCEIRGVDNKPDPIQVPGVSGDGGSYSCDFSSTWDIKAGQTVIVINDEPDGDMVSNFSFP